MLIVLSRIERGDTRRQYQDEGRLNMRNSARLPMRFPIGSKYVLESRGPFVRRYIEFPNGHRVQLPTRKAVSCECWERQQIGIVPDQRPAPIDAPSVSKKLRAGFDLKEVPRSDGT